MILVTTSTEAPVFEMKGSVMTVLVLHIKETDADRLYPQLEKKMARARSFFNSAPVVIDLSAVAPEQQAALDFVVLAETLRRLGLVPIGVRGGTEDQNERVQQAGLGLLPTVKTEKTVAAPTEVESSPSEPSAEAHQPEPSEASQSEPSEVHQPQPESSDEAPPPAARTAPTKVITLPVRSGQQVFAPDGDLIILSSVNPGAEVLAAGNIHVYGALRGRAMAGIHGDTTARILSLQCNPELVSVAGEYAVNESLDGAILHHSVMVSLSDGRLKFDVVGSFSPTL